MKIWADATDKICFGCEVEKILKVSLDLILSPPPSMKIQIMGGRVCLRCKDKTLLGLANKLLKTKKFVDINQQCFALLPFRPKI